jgi:hypothetical protein
MKADDPRLIESLERWTERVAKLDDMILMVLKNHSKRLAGTLIGAGLTICGIATA